MSLRLLLIITVVVACLPSRTAAPQSDAVFRAASELVVLHVTVKDRQGRDVAGLPQEAFSILEDGRPQAIAFFASDDAPVTIGLLIDNSGSMQSHRGLVLAATTAFVEHSNPRDEVFALTFNDTVRTVLPREMPFTSDAATLRHALADAITPQGQTALYDAIAIGQEHLAAGRYERRVLVVVSDGDDNASHVTFKEILNRTQASNVVIHAVRLVDPVDLDANPKRLEQLAQATGGVAFLPRDATQVADVLTRVALDIRTAYTVGYVPAGVVKHGFHQLRVAVRPSDGHAVIARTRAGYMAGAGNGDVHAR